MSLNAFRQQVEKYEHDSWKIPHDAAMACYDLEEWLDAGLGLLAAMKSNHARYKEDLAARRVNFSRERIEHFDRLFFLWQSACDALLSVVAKAEEAGHAIRNAAAFREASNYSHVAGFDRASIAEAAKDYETNGGKSLAEVMDELQIDPRFLGGPTTQPSSFAG